MAINMMCMNVKCKFYWEDCCTRNMNEERIVIDEDGKCETFEEGRSDWYDEDIEILRMAEERYSNDDGTRYTTDEIIKKREVKTRNMLGEITVAEKIIKDLEE